jgi:hypothetical protein
MHVNSATLEVCPRADRTTRHPTWDDIERLIDALNGQDCSSLVLEHSERDYMIVGGGAQGLYLCEIYQEEESGAYQLSGLIDPTVSETETIRMVIGELADYPRRNFVERTTALQAAKTYYERGIADERLTCEVS